MIKRTEAVVCGATILAALAVGAPASAQLYDFSTLLSQPHPFVARPAPAAPPPAVQPAPAREPSSAPPRRSGASPAAAPKAPARKVEQPASAATADEAWWRNLYVTLNLMGGYAWMRDAKTTNITTLTERRNEDWVGGNTASLGYAWAKYGIPLRSEIEALVRYRFDLDYRGTANGRLQGYTNEVATLGALANFYYDFSFLGPKWRPYLGAGVGFARHWSQSARRTLDDPNFPLSSQDTRTNNLAWAVMAGFIYNWKPSWGIRTEVRYSDLGEAVSGPFANGDKITTDYTAVDLLLGVMYNF